MPTPTEIVAQHLDNAAAIVAGAHRAGLDLSTACALIEGESRGRNIYGHDGTPDSPGVHSTGSARAGTAWTVTVGGITYPPHSDVPVSESSYRELVTRVRAGEKSNGVGLSQVTWPPFFDQAEDEGLRLWEPEDNAFFGCRLLRHSLATYAGDLLLAATEYRHGDPSGDHAYATALQARKAEWDTRLAGAGDTPTTTRNKGRAGAPGRTKKRR